MYINRMVNYLFLFLAIIMEAAGTTLLKMSQQFTKVVPSIFFFKQTPDLPAIIGLFLIVTGVAVINLFSKMSVH